MTKRCQREVRTFGISILFHLALSSSCVTVVTAQAATLPHAVDRFINAELARQHVPGMSVAILRGDSILLARGYGYCQREAAAPGN